jgi:hypothetical protein
MMQKLRSAGVVGLVVAAVGAMLGTACIKNKSSNDPIEPNGCAWTNDGICDEPEGAKFCAEGTDIYDCATTCYHKFNNVCDEPEGSGLCPEGTDESDCEVGCAYTNDGHCDEPSLCPPGTDTADCLPGCGYTNDGQCDEPEGSGVCPEGTDVADCVVGCVTCGDALFGLGSVCVDGVEDAALIDVLVCICQPETCQYVCDVDGYCADPPYLPASGSPCAQCLLDQAGGSCSNEIYTCTN